MAKQVKIKIKNEQVQMIERAKFVEGRVQLIALYAALNNDNDIVSYILNYCKDQLNEDALEVLSM
jgi:hypothetical protein